MVRTNPISGLPYHFLCCLFNRLVVKLEVVWLFTISDRGHFRHPSFPSPLAFGVTFLHSEIYSLKYEPYLNCRNPFIIVCLSHHFA